MSKNVWSAGDLDVDAELRRRSWGCLVAVGCLVAGAALSGGWLVYLACRRWPCLELASVSFGLMCLSAGLLLSVAKLITKGA